MPDANNAQDAAWRLTSLRFTGFLPAGLANVPLPEIFARVAGAAPDVDQTNRQEGSRTLTGPYGALVLNLGLQSAKLDAVLVPHPHPQLAADGFPFIAPIVEGSEAARAFVRAVLTTFSSFARIAVAASYVLPQPDLSTAYSKLGTLLPVKIAPGRSSDFMYRINRPRVFTIGEKAIVINRVSLWVAATLHTVSLTPFANAQHEVVQTAVQVQTDVNTVPTTDISLFTLEEKLTLAEALEAMSAELPIEGDVE
jgi:hypothetical protein